MFYLGALVGIAFSSLLWVLYISFFADETESMGGRMREWFRKVLHLPPVVK